MTYNPNFFRIIWKIHKNKYEERRDKIANFVIDTAVVLLCAGVFLWII